jgi:hypothetical protein
MYGERGTHFAVRRSLSETRRDKVRSAFVLHFFGFVLKPAFETDFWDRVKQF